MTHIFEDQTFDRLIDRDSGAIFSDLEFRNCQFEHCRLSVTTDPALRTVVRNAIFTNCMSVGEMIGSVVLENVTIENLKTADTFFLYGSVLKHVLLRGKFGRVVLAPQHRLLFSDVTESVARSVDLINYACARDYENIDWAIDISAAEFVECDIRNIPARLIRRDCRTQAIVKREKLLSGSWRSIDLSKTYLPGLLQIILDDGYDDYVVVAGKRDRNFRHLLRGIELLRDAGIAEPD